MSYTIVPMEKLNEVRAETNKQLKELTKSTGKQYFIRTFYIGPRPWSYSRYASRPASTLKKNARHAKLGIYEVTRREKSGGAVYINGKYSHYDIEAGKMRMHGHLIAYV